MVSSYPKCLLFTHEAFHFKFTSVYRFLLQRTERLYTTTFYVDDTNIKYRINSLWDFIKYPTYMEDFHL